MNHDDPLGMVETLQWCSFDELCRRPQLDAAFVVQCVEAGIVEVQARVPPAEWRFSAATVLRLQRARRLQRDLELQLADLVLVLDLLDEVADLRGEVLALRQRLQQWEQSGQD